MSTHNQTTHTTMFAKLSDLFTSSEQQPQARASASVLAQLHADYITCQKFQSRGYKVCSVTWEDTGRSKNSCWGPNITDQTLKVDNIAMSVIRKPNFTDETVDVPIDNFGLTVGNESGSPLRRVPLRTYLEEKGWLLPRDEKIMVSTQACVLPLTDGFCKFGVNLYNYQTRSDDPSLAVIVSSSQGSSCAAITTSNQTLYFNDKGRARPFEARRLEDDRKERKVDSLPKLQLTDEEKERNILMVFHIPLKQTKPRSERSFGFSDGCQLESACYVVTNNSAKKKSAAAVSSRGFDAAVLRVSSEDAGEFPVLKERYVRDDRFPIRCVIQTYAGTDTTTVNDETINYIVSRLSALYQTGPQGSHVVDTGDKDRVTAPTLSSAPTFPFAPMSAPTFVSPSGPLPAVFNLL